MKILVIGGTGTIGSSIVNELKSQDHTVLIASRHEGIKVDVTDPQSIENMYQQAMQQVGRLDAVMITLGSVKFNAFAEFNEEDLQFSLKHKFLVQVDIVRKGLSLQALTDEGSFTLTSGILNRRPIQTGVYAAIVNGAIDGFVKQMSIELPKQMRINAISPTVLTESLPVYGAYFPNFDPVDGKELAKIYRMSVEGKESGKIYCIDSNEDVKKLLLPSPEKSMTRSSFLYKN